MGAKSGFVRAAGLTVVCVGEVGCCRAGGGGGAVVRAKHVAGTPSGSSSVPACWWVTAPTRALIAACTSFLLSARWCSVLIITA